MRPSTLETIALIMFIIGIVLFAWKIFGNSPTDLAVIIPVATTVLLKLWSIDIRLARVETSIKHIARDLRENRDKKN